MNIKNQIRLSVLISLILVAAISISILVSNDNRQDLRDQEALAADVVRGSYELTYLSNDYLINAEPRARLQWEERYASLQPIISQLKPGTAEEAQNLAIIRDYNEKIGVLFREISEPGNLSTGAVLFPASYQQVTWSRINVQSQGMIYEAWRLRHLYNNDVNEARFWNDILVVVLMVLMLIIIGVNYLLISRRLVRAIREVNKGSEVFATGNLDYRIPVTRDDEIGGIAHRLNTMADQIHAVTASRDELDREITKRKVAEETQQESETRFRTMIDWTYDWEYWIGPGREVLYVSPSVERITGYTPSEFTTDRMLIDRIIHPDDYPLWKEHLVHHADTDQPAKHVQIEFRIIGKDGSLRWIGHVCRSIYTEDGTWAGTRISNRDITDRKQADTDLATAQKQYRDLFENVSIGILRSTPGPEGAMIEVNPAAIRIFEADSREQLLAVRPSDLYIDHDERRRISEEIVSKGAISRMEVRYKTLKGRAFWGSITSSKKVSDDGQVYFDNTIEDITERKRSEEVLKESEDKFATAFKTSPYAITITRMKDGSFIEVNDAFTPMTGFTHKEALSGSSVGFGLWVDAEERKRVIATLLDGRTVSGEEFLFRKKDGGIIAGLFSARIISLNNEPCILSSINDITDRKRAEEALQKSENEFRSLAESMPQIVWITRADGWNIYFNQQWVDYTGLTLEESYGHGWNIPFHPDDRQRAWDAWQRATQHLDTYSLECRLRRADGAYRWWLIRGVPVHNAGGEILKWFGTCTDIEEIKRAEEALRASEHHLLAVLDATPFPIALVDVVDNNIHFWSRSALTLFGHTAPTAAEWFEIAYPDPGYRREVLGRWKPALEMARLSGQVVNAGEYQVTCRDGSVRICELYAVFLADRLIVTFNDITERKAAEEKIKASETRYRRLFEAAKDGILILNRETGEIIDANPFIETLLGYPPQDLRGKHLWDIGLFKDMLLSKIAFEDLQAKEYLRYEDLPLETKDGKRIEVEFISNLYPVDASTSVIQCNIRDITDRKRTEDALRETTDYLRNLLDYANAPIIVWDPQFRITRFNHAFERLTGRAEQDVVGQHLSILFPDASRIASLEQIQKTLAGERWETVEIPIQHLSGEVRIVLWNSANIVDPHGVIISTIAQGIDITERKQAIDSLRESEVSFRVLAENLPGIVYRIHLQENNRMVFFNDQLKVLSGYSSDELGFGKICSIEPHIHPDDLPRVLAVVDKAVGEFTTFIVEYRFQHKDGSWRYFIERGKVVTGQNAQPLYIDGVIHDITVSKQIEQQREALIQELEQKNAELERFTYTVSHDLKSPLITIKGFAGLIESDAQNGDAVQLKMDINRITAAADTMQDLLADVLELSRIGRVVSPPEKTSFGTLSHEAVELLAVSLAERGVSVEIAPDLPFVSVDHARIREVMVNLIENATKFMGDQEHPAIRIGVETDGPVPVFFVRDNGIGINPRYLERIFNLFERLDTSTHGTGIGLTIVRRIIEVHGGKIWAESEGVGKGTTFRFTLPGPAEEGHKGMPK